jgi:hypothetical protein
MPESNTTFFNRRDAARAALTGGVMALFSASPLHAQHAGSTTFLSAKDFGATGDGATDDTAALQRTIDAAAEKNGGVFLPPGVYRTRELQVRAGVAVIGVPAWNYSFGGGTVLKLADESARGLLNLTDARGATIEGLSLDGGHLGKIAHGIFTMRTTHGSHEDGFRIERCQVARFTGDGLNLSHVWCFTVRHCQIAFNHGDGLRLQGWDGFILDNWFSGNGGAGFAAREENASVTFTANRVEWNGEENLVIMGGDGYQITGNFFDRAGTVGVALRQNPESASGNKGPCKQITITGNFVKRSGRFAKADSYDSAQILLQNAAGVTCVGNVMDAGRDDGYKGAWSPSYGIVCGGLENCVVAHNTLHSGALRQLVVDLGNHRPGTLIKDNYGSLFTPGM